MLNPAARSSPWREHEELFDYGRHSEHDAFGEKAVEKTTGISAAIMFYCRCHRVGDPIGGDE